VVIENPDGDGYRYTAKPIIAKVDAPLQADPRLRMPPRLQKVDQRKALLEQLKRQSVREKSPTAGLMIDIDNYLLRPSKFDLDVFLAHAVQNSERLVSPQG
jgi:hypothetical protein